MPPVTALRSPPDSRITGADSPVIADSSTEAMPSITVPSPGISLAGLDDDDVAAVQLGRRPASPPSRRRATVSVRIARSVVGLRAAAALGERLGEVGEDDRQPQPDRDAEREPGRLVAAAERLAAEDLDQPGDGGDHRADLDHEHHRVADLHARVELLTLSISARHDDVALEQRDRAALARARAASGRSVWVRTWSGCLQAVEGEVQLEHVQADP